MSSKIAGWLFNLSWTFGALPPLLTQRSLCRLAESSRAKNHLAINSPLDSNSSEPWCHFNVAEKEGSFAATCLHHPQLLNILFGQLIWNSKYADLGNAMLARNRMWRKLINISCSYMKLILRKNEPNNVFGAMKVMTDWGFFWSLLNSPSTCRNEPFYFLLEFKGKIGTWTSAYVKQELLRLALWVKKKNRGKWPVWNRKSPFKFRLAGLLLLTLASVQIKQTGF